MFERFTDRARRVVVLAQEEARMLNHNYIGTEHILLGLIHEGEGVAAKALESMGISLEAVREQVGAIIGQGQHAPSGHIPFTPRAKKVLELSLREGLQLGHDYIGTEHILLGLVREGEGVAAQVLVKMGADLNRVRQVVVELLHGSPGSGQALGGPGVPGRRGRAAALDDVLFRLDSIAARLTAIERRLGIAEPPRPDLREHDELIAAVRREKESAIDVQDFEKASALRDKEKELLVARAAREQEWKAAADARKRAPQADDTDIVAVTEEAERLRGEVARLEALLRQHGVEPGDAAAPGDAASPGGASPGGASPGGASPGDAAAAGDAAQGGAAAPGDAAPGDAAPPDAEAG